MDNEKKPDHPLTYDEVESALEYFRTYGDPEAEIIGELPLEF